MLQQIRKTDGWAIGDSPSQSTQKACRLAGNETVVLLGQSCSFSSARRALDIPLAVKDAPDSGVLRIPSMLEGLRSVEDHTESGLPLLLPCALLHLLCCFLCLGFSRLLPSLGCRPDTHISACRREYAHRCCYGYFDPWLLALLPAAWLRKDHYIQLFSSKDARTTSLQYKYMLHDAGCKRQRCSSTVTQLKRALTLVLRRHPDYVSPSPGSAFPSHSL